MIGERIRTSAVPAANKYRLGWPKILGPTEARVKPPTVPALSQTAKLTYKIGGDGDFMVEAITCFLWRIIAGSPNTVALVDPRPEDPTAGTGADVRLTFFDGAAGALSSTEPTHWSNIAGDAGQPHWLGNPLRLTAGGSYSVRAANLTNQAFGLSLQLHGRRLFKPRTQADLQRAVELERQALVETRGYETPHFLGFRSQEIQLISGNFDTPSAASGNNFQKIETGADAPFIATAFNAQQRVSGSALYAVNNTRPVLVRVYDDRQEYELTNGPVPFGAVFGRAEHPGRLPCEWNLGSNAQLRFEFFSMDTSTVFVSAGIAGYYRGKDF